MDLIDRKRALEEMTFSSGIEQDGVLYVPLRDVNNHLKNLPSEAYLQTIATERYEDLCEYFGNQENPILTDRREFKRWLDRVRWHVKKVDELVRRSEDDWCTECKEFDHEKHHCPRFNRVIKETAEEIRGYMRSMEKQEQKKGKWIIWGGMDIPENHGKHKCSECGEFAPTRYDKPLIKECLSDFCPNCGADMRGEQDETD